MDAGSGMSGRAVIETLTMSSRTSERSERDPGPITTNDYCECSCSHSHLSQLTSVVMGPGLRRDDSEILNLHLRLWPIPVPQMPLHQLAGRGARQFGLEVDAF